MPIRFVRQKPDLDLATEIASSGFVQPISKALQLDVDVHLNEGRIVYTIFDDDRVVGFAIFKVIGEDVLYLAGIMLHESVQGKGIAELAVKHANTESYFSHLALRTQSLRMWVAGNKMMRDWFPNPENRIHEPLRHVRNMVASHLKMPADVLSAPGFYGAPLYGKKPVHRDVALQKWWDSICSFERGDAVLCVGSLVDPSPCPLGW